MPDQFQSIIDQLRQQEATFLSQVTDLKQQLKQAESGLKQTRDALQSLGHTKAGKATRKSTKPAPKQQEVINLITELLDHQQPMKTDDLKEAVKQTLKDQGHSLYGLSLRFKEALEHTRFVDSPGGIRLAKDEDELSPKPAPKERKDHRQPTEAVSK